MGTLGGKWVSNSLYVETAWGKTVVVVEILEGDASPLIELISLKSVSEMRPGLGQKKRQQKSPSP